MRLFKRKRKRIFIPHFTTDDLGIGPSSDGKGNFRCDVCHKLRPASEVSISLGDGFVECIHDAR